MPFKLKKFLKKKFRKYYICEETEHITRNY